jgi:hypothetical protein
MSDRLHDTLSALRTDVESTPLADSSAVRARGTQRTRRQAIGTTLAVVALVAGAVGIGGALTGTNKAEDLPATRNTTSTAPTVEDRGPLRTSALLTPDMIPVPTNAQKLVAGETLESPTAADIERLTISFCGGKLNPAIGPAPVTSFARTFHNELDVFAWEWIAQYDGDNTAKDVFNELKATCAGAPGVQTKAIGVSTSPETVRASQFSAPPDSEFHGEVTGIVWWGDTVAVLGLRAQMREGDLSLKDFDRAIEGAANLVAIH